MLEFYHELQIIATKNSHIIQTCLCVNSITARLPHSCCFPNYRVRFRLTEGLLHQRVISNHEKSFTKVTSPLGSRAAMRWGSSPHARTKNKTICLWRMVLFWGSAPCGRSTPRGSDMPGASELPLRQDFAAQNTCDGAPAPPHLVGSRFGRHPY